MARILMSAALTLLLVVSTASLLGCTEPPDPTTAPAVPGERSPEENEPAPEAPTAPTGALGAAALERAVRMHEDNPEGARALLRTGCDEGTLRSCIALSEMLEAEGSAESLAEAAAVIEQACGAGSTEACDRMGH